ncbi:hypothetical protein KQI84_16820 [bacterium]|nr:hypothetical protein [bacterium]
MLRHEGEKPLVDAIMIPDTLLTIQAAARAANGLSWLLIGSQAASCWMGSRATVEIEVLVPTPHEQALVESRLDPLPGGHRVLVRTAEQAGASVDSVVLWSSRARWDDVGGTTVLVPQPADLFLLMLAESRLIEAPQAMYFAARLLQLHGPFDLAEEDLSPYQQERLSQAAALVIHHAADELEKLDQRLATAVEW